MRFSVCVSASAITGMEETIVKHETHIIWYLIIVRMLHHGWTRLTKLPSSMGADASAGKYC